MSTTIAHELTDRLRKQIGQGGGVVEVNGDGASVAVDVEQSERYAVGVRGITVTPTQPVADVRDAAERIAHGVTELDGPLTVVEYDTRQDQAIVRSAEPEADETGVTYWEADVRADETTLQRYRKDHAAPDREQITEPLLHSTVGRVAEQLVDALKQPGQPDA
ncbi:MAG: hypothetical protein CYG59_26285 [Chloroflexi bacterium]|nr:MAG: hypothetical protein CYG59_26285 [Chloroflexota bacterium]